MDRTMLAEPAELPCDNTVIFDCRFSLLSGGEGREVYQRGHIPGAHYLHLEQDLSGPVAAHGGRHPLPPAVDFVTTLGKFGVGPETDVIAYDDSRLAFAARLWWMMRSLGFRPPRLLNGGYQGWLAAGGVPQTQLPQASPVVPLPVTEYSGCCDIEGLRQAQAGGALVLDSREQKRYLGLEEPIDPVAGHIPGALNRPWQGVTTESGWVKSSEQLAAHWGDVLAEQSPVIYCGSGVTACVNLFSLALLGREDAILYGGSWSDWCSWL